MWQSYGQSPPVWQPRIKAVTPCAWFNQRRNKRAIPDPRYSCFLETREEHAFFRGWLTEFTDSDAVALMCPRPLLVQADKQDRIARRPRVMEDFEESRKHYEKLGLITDPSKTYEKMCA